MITRSTSTPDLIANLSREAGSSMGSETFQRKFNLIVGLALAIPAALVFAWIGPRPEFWMPGHLLATALKLAGTLSMAGGAVWLARDAVLPGRRSSGYWVVLFGILIFVTWAVVDSSGLSMMGRSDISVYSCVSAIVVVSLPALMLTLGIQRIGAPTHPIAAGAAAGLAAGAMGAAAYALGCQNDAGLFVLVWYMLAILIVTVLGAVVGRPVLSW